MVKTVLLCRIKDLWILEGKRKGAVISASSVS
nr:MAG TPA: hypothetical protein [Caudoviricetes sp.]